MHVNTTKTKLMTIDGITGNRTDTVTVTYRDEPLTLTPESETVRYLGFWAIPNDNMKVAMDLVFERTIKAKETIQGHPLAQDSMETQRKHGKSPMDIKGHGGDGIHHNSDRHCPHPPRSRR
jgi:hypothetical protein